MHETASVIELSNLGRTVSGTLVHSGCLNALCRQQSNVSLAVTEPKLFSVIQWRIQRGGGRGSGRPPIDRMHLKTYENFAPKCVIFASNFQKFSGEGA